MLADRPQPQTLPLVPAFLCVLGAGFATGVVFQLQSSWATRLVLVDPQLMQLSLSLAGALIGAWAVRLLLRGVCGFTIRYWRAYGALVAGDLVALALVAALFGWARQTAGTDALPGLFGPQLLGLILSVYLLQRFASPLGLRAQVVTGDLTLPVLPRTGVSDRDLYDEVVSAARDASLGLVELAAGVPTAEAPHVIANGLVGLELATKTLEEHGCPVPELGACHARLVQALKQLADDLVEAAAEAGRSGSDQGDNGARYRWSLSQSVGVQAVREALEELGRHGLGTTW